MAVPLPSSDVGHVYPNELAYEFELGGVTWKLLIVMYSYFIGLMVGSLMIAVLSYGFNFKKYYRVAGIAIILTLSLLVSPLLGWAEIKQPQRALEIFLRPHIVPSEAYPGVSPMAVFYILYLIGFMLIVAGSIFAFRADVAKRASERRSLIYRVLALGREYDKVGVERDRRIAKTLLLAAGLVIVVAAIVHGYIFSSVKARFLWSDPLLPLHSLAAAILSGAALVAVAYYIACRVSRVEVDIEVLSGLSWIMLWALVALLGLEFMSDIAREYYRLPGHGMEYLETLASGLISLKIYRLLSLILLVALLTPWVRRNAYAVLAVSVGVLLDVLLYKWVVIIVPQLLSRTGEGFLSYTPALWEVRVIVGVVALMALIFLVLSLIFPWNGYYVTRSDELKGVISGGER
ncbi:MAG: polysulfide reductase NrfD [Desulfurococcales archaeon]|nr:polysulfide reductase NrfD [Desulfurococcales archaeon]